MKPHGSKGYHGKWWGVKILFLPLFFFAGAWAVMFLWNRIAPTAFGGGILGYWQSLGLLILSRILLGGRFFPGPSGHKMSRKNREEWKSRMYEKYGHGERQSEHHKDYREGDKG